MRGTASSRLVQIVAATSAVVLLAVAAMWLSEGGSDRASSSSTSTGQSTTTSRPQGGSGPSTTTRPNLTPGDTTAVPVLTEGPLIENHPRFPERVNAGYAEVVDRHRLKLRVWERGAGETLACGTGACAAAVACIRRGLVDSPVRVSTHGGDLTIRWDGGDNPVLMTGPAVAVFDGEIDLDESRA